MVNLTRIITHHQPEHFDYDLIRLAQSVVLPSIWSRYSGMSTLTIASSGFFQARVCPYFFVTFPILFFRINVYIGYYLAHNLSTN